MVPSRRERRNWPPRKLARCGGCPASLSCPPVPPSRWRQMSRPSCLRWRELMSSRRPPARRSPPGDRPPRTVRRPPCRARPARPGAGRSRRTPFPPPVTEVGDGDGRVCHLAAPQSAGPGAADKVAEPGHQVGVMDSRGHHSGVAQRDRDTEINAHGGDEVVVDPESVQRGGLANRLVSSRRFR